MGLDKASRRDSDCSDENLSLFNLDQMLGTLPSKGGFENGC